MLLIKLYKIIILKIIRRITNEKIMILISLLTVSILIVGCNNNKEQNNNKVENNKKEEVIRINEDTRISLKTPNEVSESERKNIHIDPFETGIFDIRLEKEEGDIRFDVYDGRERIVIQ